MLNVLWWKVEIYKLVSLLIIPEDLKHNRTPCDLHKTFHIFDADQLNSGPVLEQNTSCIKAFFERAIAKNF